MKKLCILTVLIAAMTVSGFSGGVMAKSSVLIENGDIENGINGFGICYSGKADTVMPSLRESNILSKEGAALEFIPGESLDAASSSSPASKDFAYQGVFNNSAFNMSKGVKYNFSADVYSGGAGPKMRFVLVADNRAIAASDEFEVYADKWSSASFAYTSDKDIENVRLRVAFYDIKYGESIYIDNIKCSEAIVSDSMWTADGEEVSVADGKVTFTTSAGAESVIAATTDGDKYTTGEIYGLSAIVSTEADKAYVSFIVGGAHRDCIVTKDESVKLVLPFEAAGKDNILKVAAVTDKASEVTLSDIEVVDKYSIINIAEENGKILVSGVLRGGNENEEITVQIGDIETVTATVSATGSYTAKTDIPDIDGAQKKIRVTVSDIIGYNDMGGKLYTDYVIINPEYADSIAEQVSGKTKVQVETALTTEVMDNLGVSVIPAVKSADKDDIYKYLADKTITDGAQLVNEIKTAAALSSLDARAQKLSDITDEYAALLEADEVSAYEDIYGKADKDVLNSMFRESKADINDIEDYKYALCETLVRYEMRDKINYSQQLELLKKYDDELNLDFTEFNKLPSVKQYSVAAEWLKDIRSKTDYSGLQDSLDKLVREAKKDDGDKKTSGGGGGGGGGAGVKIDNKLVEQTIAENIAAQQYRFNDLEDYAWAADSIYNLVDKGVISKPDDRIFNPSDNVTRAELAKMTAILFDIAEYGGSEAKFNDVKTDDWYYRYVMALYENEVVKGMSDTEFGSEMPVTRQDICVIFARLLGESATGTGAGFTDIAEADDYAKDAILLMQELEIINGYEDGSFRPLGYATRAEISHILYKISNR